MSPRRATALAAVVLLAAGCSRGGGASSSGSTGSTSAGGSTSSGPPSSGATASTASSAATAGGGAGTTAPPAPGTTNGSGPLRGGINGPVAPASTAAATRTQQVCDGAPVDAVGRVLAGTPTALPPVESSGAGFYVTCAWGSGAATLDADYALAATAGAADRDWTALKASLGPTAQPVAGVGDEALATVTATMFGARSGLVTLRLTVVNTAATPVRADLATIANGVLRAGA